MGYIANVPLKFGGKRIHPGERVPVERGRSYLSMIRLGQITVVRDSEPESAPGEMEWFTRRALNELAEKAGVEEPEKFSNKASLITAIREQHSGDLDDDE